MLRVFYIQKLKTIACRNSWTIQKSEKTWQFMSNSKMLNIPTFTRDLQSTWLFQLCSFFQAYFFFFHDIYKNIVIKNLILSVRFIKFKFWKSAKNILHIIYIFFFKSNRSELILKTRKNRNFVRINSNEDLKKTMWIVFFYLVSFFCAFSFDFLEVVTFWNC